MHNKPQTQTINRQMRDYRGAPIIGPLLEMRRDFLGFFTKIHRECGDLVHMHVGPQQLFFLGHPDHAQHVLVDNLRNYEKETKGYNALRRLLGNGLVTSSGEFWQRQRRIAQPAFRRQRVEAFALLMVKATQDMCDNWQVRIDQKQPIDFATEMMKVTLRIVSETLMSTDVSADAGEIAPALHELLKQNVDDITMLFRAPDCVPTPRNRRFVKAKATLDRIVLGMIAQRRQDDRDHGDLLSMLMAKDEQSGESMTDLQLRDEVMTIFLAGHETTANALGWTCHQLTLHPEMADRARQEVDDALQGRAPTVQDLAHLPYVSAVLKESMRLFPPVWVLARSVVQDDVIDQTPIPKGAYVFLSQYTVHRHPDFWDRPEVFDPLRWLNDDQKTESKLPHKYMYFPFSTGARKCIGDHFATMEAVLILAVLLQRVQWQLVAGHPVELEPVVTLRPKYGLQMQVQARN